MIINKASEIICNPLFFQFDSETYLKLEGLNIAGSIKLKAAKKMVEDMEKKGRISSSTTIIESSSGNLGIALSIICKEKGIKFICVIDHNIMKYCEKLMMLYGAKLIRVTKKDKNGGYLGSRINCIKKLLKENENFIWLNQYANQINVDAHYKITAQEIIKEFDDLDYLFVGIGTSGTITGCAKGVKKAYKNIKVIAVDACGSVTFGGKAKKRFIPGIGTSRCPEIVEKDLYDEVIHINEIDTIKACYDALHRYGLLLGGSSGSVLSAINKFKKNIPSGSRIVGISPDFGDKYIDTIYNPIWIKNIYHTDVNKISPDVIL